MERDVAERMARHRNHCKRALRCVEINAIAIGNAVGCQLNLRVVGGINVCRCQFLQPGHTADVVGMVMGEQDRAQLKMLTMQRILNRRGLAWVDHERIAEIIMEHPDVVVGQCWQWLEVQGFHGSNYSGSHSTV